MLLSSLALVARAGLDGAAWTVTGDREGARLGSHVKPAGDVNGDGYGDLLVAAIRWSPTGGAHGRVELYLGGPGGPASEPHWFAMGSEATSMFGHPVAPAGDLDGDGYDDFFVGEPRHPVSPRLHLFAGGPEGPAADPTWTHIVANEVFGDDMLTHVANVGDVDGDGAVDILVGAAGATGDLSGEGLAWLHRVGRDGIEDTPWWSHAGGTEGAFLGTSLAALGDTNGDGYPDFAIGAHNMNTGVPNAGEIRVFHGAPSGPGALPDRVLRMDQPQGYFGVGTAGVGDVDGDGFADLVGTSGRYDDPAGEVDAGAWFLFLGGTDGVATTPSWAQFGSKSLSEPATAAGADVNGDGFADVLLGAPGDHDDGQTNEGRVYGFRGTAAGLEEERTFLFESDVPDTRLGASVAFVGDVDGDGCPDMLVGAPGWSEAFEGQGLAALFTWAGTGGVCLAEPADRYSGIACGCASGRSAELGGLVALLAWLARRRQGNGRVPGAPGGERPC